MQRIYARLDAIDDRIADLTRQLADLSTKAVLEQRVRELIEEAIANLVLRGGNQPARAGTQ